APLDRQAPRRRSRRDDRRGTRLRRLALARRAPRLGGHGALVLLDVLHVEIVVGDADIVAWRRGACRRGRLAGGGRRLGGCGRQRLLRLALALFRGALRRLLLFARPTLLVLALAPRLLVAPALLFFLAALALGFCLRLARG